VKKQKPTDVGSGDEEEVQDSFTTVGKSGKAIQYTAEGIFKTLQLVQEARGKKVSSVTTAVLS
jgi:translation initiation factor 3 subunit C